MTTDLNAQLRIVNNSSCTITAWGVSSDNSSCNSCGITAQTQLTPFGGNVTYPYDPSCGPDELWLAVRWYVASLTPFPGAQQAGQAFNPLFTCGINQVAFCNNVGLTATWNFGGGTGGYGPVTVIIQ